MLPLPSGVEEGRAAERSESVNDDAVRCLYGFGEPVQLKAGQAAIGVSDPRALHGGIRHRIRSIGARRSEEMNRGVMAENLGCVQRNQGDAIRVGTQRVGDYKESGRPHRVFADAKLRR